MFDFGFSELLLVAVIALIVLGPERLPKAARMAGSLVGRLQRLVSSVKQELSAQMEMEELRKAKSEFESAANEFRSEIKSIGSETQHELGEISDGLKPWDRLPEQKTPADFGVDENGNPLPIETLPNHSVAEIAHGDEAIVAGNDALVAESITPEEEQSRAWRDYLTQSSVVSSSVVETTVIDYQVEPSVIHTVSVRKQAMQRKRDMRPRLQAKPKLRIRKK